MSHSERTPYCRVSYWRQTEEGTVAADAADDWTRCVVEAHGLGGCRHEFSREQKYEQDKLLRFLEIAFEAGRWNKAAEVRKVIGL